MIVMKFGGTSVEDAAAMKNVAAIVRTQLHRRPVVVSSACARVTNELLAIAQGARDSGRDGSLDRVEKLRARHRGIAHDLFSGDVLISVDSQIDAMMDQMRDLVRSISILGELTDRSLDTFASFGERLSTLLLTYLFRREGVDTVLVDARDVIVTNDDYTRAAPIFEETAKRALQVIEPRLRAGQLVVTQGFLGSTLGGVTTTIGRGGSDYSAAIFGAALAAEEIQIWTDVDGMMTSDPRLIKTARLIKEMTFQEAAELAYFGARVLHPSTILPAVQKDIPVRVLNSKRPESEGTLIVRQASGKGNGLLKAIAHKGGIILININSTRMLMMHGFLAKVFEIFARYGKSVDVIATSEVSLSLTVDNDDDLESIFTDLRLIADVDVEREKAIFCVVGEKLRYSKGVIARIFSVLDKHDIGVSMISLGASEVNVTFVVDGRDVKKAAEVLHDEFFPEER